jgi:ATP-dependent DNA helicase
LKAGGDAADFSELQALLSRDDGEHIDITSGKSLLTDADLAILTDRSPEAFVRAEKGLDTAGDFFKAVQTDQNGNGLLKSLEK